MDLKTYYKERRIKLILIIVFFLLTAICFGIIATDCMDMIDQRQVEWEARRFNKI